MKKNTAEADARIVALLGPEFTEFQKLALLVKEQPATRPWASAQMAKLLEAMPPAQRLALRQALRDAGAMKGGKR
jgi:hypothetical protein